MSNIDKVTTDIYRAVTMLLCKYANISYDDRIKDEIKCITQRTRPNIDSILLAVNYIYKLIVGNDHQLFWKPYVVYSTSLWIAMEIQELMQVDIHVWHEKTKIPLGELKKMELIIKGCLGHNLYLTPNEFDSFKIEFLKSVSICD
eukprot:NODE_180_length_15790_cov_0.586706.p8 type:complete len:145 gc:universal NODE_180_length_15790_cov_0.586706:7110-6676(-)